MTCLPLEQRPRMYPYSTRIESISLWSRSSQDNLYLLFLSECWRSARIGLRRARDLRGNQQTLHIDSFSCYNLTRLLGRLQHNLFVVSRQFKSEYTLLCLTVRTCLFLILSILVHHLFLRTFSLFLNGSLATSISSSQVCPIMLFSIRWNQINLKLETKSLFRYALVNRGCICSGGSRLKSQESQSLKNFVKPYLRRFGK